VASTIHFAAMSDVQHQDDQYVTLQSVDHAPVANAQPVTAADQRLNVH